MVSNILTQDVPVAADVKMPAVEKVGAVAAAQSLPQDGKKLPQDNHKQAEIKEDDIEQAVERMNDHVQLVKRQLEFKIDEDSGRTVITVLDSDTQEIIRQIPDDEALHFARKLQQGDELELFDKFA